MKIVIDIPDKDYERLKVYEKAPFCSLTSRVYEAIANGVPLPKGHGDLIDADELFWDIQTDEDMRLGKHFAWVKEKIDDAPTIIEADKAESEVEE